MCAATCWTKRRARSALSLTPDTGCFPQRFFYVIGCSFRQRETCGGLGAFTPAGCLNGGHHSLRADRQYVGQSCEAGRLRACYHLVGDTGCGLEPFSFMSSVEYRLLFSRRDNRLCKYSVQTRATVRVGVAVFSPNISH